ncbi:hypothetical protein B0H13DRAFT_2314587 [Mycena leptocephala]|nr:hypothetical protein B0H13DRAFT_2314587 [Mycena leptocephala]
MADAPIRQIVTERVVLLYPWGVSARQTAIFTMKATNVTLAQPDFLEGWFYCSPGNCGTCRKPHLKHPAIHGASFTILISCPHHPHLRRYWEDDDESEVLLPNKAVAKILPDNRQHQTCRGNLVVVKHPLPNDAPPTVLNHTLPIVDVVAADFPHIDELVRRWVIHLYDLEQSEEQESQAV